MDTTHQNKPFWNKRYTIEKELGKGGMGRVYLATDSLTNQQVAIKECLVRLQKNPENTIERIYREYYCLNKIDHDNLVKAIDFFPMGKNYCIVMEYADGVHLKEYIKNYKKTISVNKQLEIVKQICDVVAVLNENNIIHRDIKPENIILTNDGLKPKLLDLGIAKAINEELVSLTSSGNIVGTAKYISPEQLNGQVFPNTDVFLLGILLYQFFSWSENSPFDGGDAICSIARVCEVELPPLFPEFVKNPYISQVVESALQKDATKRAKNPREMLILLERASSFVENKPPEKEFRKTNIHVRKTIKTNFQKNKKPSSKQKLLSFVVLFAVIATYIVGDFLYKREMEKELLLFVEKAEKSFAQEKYDEAEAYYSKAIYLAPEKAELYLKRGKIYTFLVNYDLAIIDFEKATELDSSNMEANYWLSNIYYKKKDYNLAEKYSTKAIEIEPNNTQNYFLRSKIYKVQEKYDLSIVDCEKALQLDSKHAYIYKLRGDLHYEKKEHKLAEKAFTKAIEIEPNDAELYTKRAMINHLERKYDLVQKDLTKAIEMEPNNAMFYYQRALCSFDHNTNLAQKDLTKAIEIEPNNSEFHFQRANLYYLQRKYDLAQKDLTKAIEIEPNNLQFYFVRGRIYSIQNRYDLAEKDFTTRIEIEPNNPTFYTTRANLYYSQHKYDLAEKDFTKAIQIDPNNPKRYKNRALIYECQNKYELTKADYTKAIELSPENSDTYQSRGSLYFNNKKYRLAILDWQKAIELGSRNFLLQHMIAKAKKLAEEQRD